MHPTRVRDGYKSILKGTIDRNATVCLTKIQFVKVEAEAVCGAHIVIPG